MRFWKVAARRYTITVDGRRIHGVHTREQVATWLGLFGAEFEGLIRIRKERM